MYRVLLLALFSMPLAYVANAADKEEKVPYAVLKGWYESRVEKPAILVLKDETAYSKTFAEVFGKFHSDLSGKPLMPEKVDFETKQVVAVCWSAMPSTGYEISVVTVTGDTKETTITVKTTVPEGLASAAIRNPAVVLAIPKTDKVRVIVTGDRNPSGRWWKDFSNAMSSKGMEVIVQSASTGR